MLNSVQRGDIPARQNKRGAVQHLQEVQPDHGPEEEDVPEVYITVTH